MQIGDIVKVVDTGYRYASYTMFSDRFCGGEDICSGVLYNEDCCVIEAYGRRFLDNEDTTQPLIFAIRRLTDNELFLVEDVGVAQVSIKKILDFIERGNPRRQYNRSWSTVYHGWE